MNVTKPETIAPLWYLTWTANERNKKNTVVALMLASAKEATSSTVGGTDLSDKVSSDRQLAVVGRDNHQSRAKSTGPSLLLNSASQSFITKRITIKSWHCQEPVHVSVGIVEGTLVNFGEPVD